MMWNRKPWQSVPVDLPTGPLGHKSTDKRLVIEGETVVCQAVQSWKDGAHPVVSCGQPIITCHLSKKLFLVLDWKFFGDLIRL